jgi:hypothetical protein
MSLHRHGSATKPAPELRTLSIRVHYVTATDELVPKVAAYSDFLTLWKEADPDIPIPKQAKAEYAKLQ